MVLKVLYALGGTGGHIFPAIALSQVRESYQHLFVTLESELRRKLIQSLPVKVEVIPGGRPSLREALRNFKGLMASINLLKREAPDLVIATGSYACVPIALASILLRIPLYLIEGNTIPGRAILFLSRFARKVFLSFRESVSYFPKSLQRRSERLVVTGNPVRMEFWDIRADYSFPGSLVFIGGSQGGQWINELGIRFLEEVGTGFDLVDEVVLVTGQRDYERVKDKLSHSGFPLKVRVIPFCKAPWKLFSRAVLVVSRAGASTLWELGISARPSILVPYPFAKDNHQRLNAEFFLRMGGGILMDQENTSLERGVQVITELLRERGRLIEFRDNLLRSFKENPSLKVWREIESAIK